MERELEDVIFKYKALSDDYKKLDQHYLVQMNSQSNDKMNEKVLSLTSSNAKLTKENELMKANLSDIYTEIKEILVKG